MGTSVSNPGPGSGVSLIPPWVSDPGTEEDNPDVEQELGGDATSLDPILMQIAPKGRFKGARTNLGWFASFRFQPQFEKGSRSYTSGRVWGDHALHPCVWSERLERLVNYTAYSKRFLLVKPLRLIWESTFLFWQGLPARETIDHIAQALSPSDGTQDSEASRHSMSQALSELISREPTADLTALTPEQIELAMELYIGADICRRLELDIGKTILDKAPSPASAIRRLGKMNRYVRQALAASFRRRSANSGPFTQRTVTRVVSRIIQDTFEVFESYSS